MGTRSLRRAADGRVAHLEQASGEGWSRRAINRRGVGSVRGRVACGPNGGRDVVAFDLVPFERRLRL